MNTTAAKFIALALSLCAGSAALAGLSAFHTPRQTPTARPAEEIAGDYVEARTASVFCGACHYNSELMNSGRDAVMAWNFTAGDYHGVNLKGVRVMADVSAEDNLSYLEKPHQTQLIVDTAASDKQVDAVRQLIADKCGSQLGTIVSVVRAPITFAHNEEGYRVSAKDLASVEMTYRTDKACCLQPYLVWYEPFSPVAHRMVGFTESASYSGTMTPPWSRSEEDSAFYGDIAF